MANIFIVGGFMTNQVECFSPQQIPTENDDLVADQTTLEFTVTDGFVANSLCITNYEEDINYIFNEEPRSNGQIQNEDKYEIFNMFPNITRVD